MRSSFLAFALVATVAAAAFGSTAFNYAQVTARVVTMNIPDDTGGYIGIASDDANYACFVKVDGTSGKLSVTFDDGTASGTPCSGAGTGMNPASKYTFLKVLKVTNKGQKAWQRLWVNSTSTLVTTNLTYSSDTPVTTATFNQQEPYSSSLAVGDYVRVNVYVDGSTKTKADNAWTADLTFEARATT